MKVFLLQFSASLILTTLLVVWEIRTSRRTGKPCRLLLWSLSVLALLNLLFNGFLWMNHIGFPLHLDLMEGTVFQHYQRALAFEPIYTEPTPEFVPLAYNPLYYFWAVPFGWIFGASLWTLRLVSILGMLGSALLIYFVTARKTGSAWWGLMAAGLFATAYRVMDAYLDSAHSDSWLLCSALAGTVLIDLNRSRRSNLLGVAMLVASFWFKQHGALFAIGGVCFLTWREGVKASWPYWLLAFVGGPLLYTVGGTWLFGSYFHYFTWEVPRSWSVLDLGAVLRYGKFLLKYYPVLLLAGSVWILFTLQKKKNVDIWMVQFGFALLSGLMGSLDWGSSNNVYIPIGTFCIVLGTIGLYEWSRQFPSGTALRISRAGVCISFFLLLYNPLEVILPRNAKSAYRDFVQMLRHLEAPVYAPWLGQMSSDFTFYPAGHWIALEDMVRGSKLDTRNRPTTRRLLAPLLKPKTDAYILANYPLKMPLLAFLNEYVVLEQDLGDRFKPLHVLPKRWDTGWPRYLYRTRRSLNTGQSVLTKRTPSSLQKRDPDASPCEGITEGILRRRSVRSLPARPCSPKELGMEM